MLTYEQALAWIHGRLKFGSRPGLIRIEALLEKLGNPHHKLRCVHIAGTNGKGSTTAFLRELLQAEDLKVATFTSPYIEMFNERICINGEPISNQDLVAWVEKLQPLVAELDQDLELAGITEFEIITALAFDYFLAKKVDIALIEVGLGGLLDSTNVITPLVSVITTIGCDHMAILGSTLTEIAIQKAGIIKQGKPVVIGELPAEANTVMIQTAKKNQSPIYQFGTDFTIKKEDATTGQAWQERFSFYSEFGDFPDLISGLLGEHQMHNAALAVETFLLLSQELDFTIEAEKVRFSLLNTNWPGRMEKMSDQPLILLDGAHNEPAILQLCQNITHYFKERKIYILFAALTRKNFGEMIHQLENLPKSQLYLTSFDYPQAATAPDYQELKLAKETLIIEDWQSALKEIQQIIQPEDVLLITGSLYFISEVRKKLKKADE